jgi:transposase
VVVSSAGRAIGLDVHLEFCEVAVCEGGQVRSAGRVQARPEAFEALAASLLPSDRVALEVTGSAWEIVRILEPHVAKVIVVSPGDTGISQARAKTDRLDARTLARLLWVGDLDGVWTPDGRTRVLRRRLSRRAPLVRSRSRCKNEVHAVLMRRMKGRCPLLGHVWQGGPAMVALARATGRGMRDGGVDDASDRVSRR